jgi:hypothetical protein
MHKKGEIALLTNYGNDVVKMQKGSEKSIAICPFVLITKVTAEGAILPDPSAASTTSRAVATAHSSSALAFINPSPQAVALHGYLWKSTSHAPVLNSLYTAAT